MNNESIDITLSKEQKRVLSQTRRFTLWRAARRIGKTHAAEYWWCKRALTMDNSVNWYIAQDNNLCKELNIPLFEKFVPHKFIKDYSKSDKCYTLFNNSRCYFKSANSSDSLRGRGIDNLVCEEPPFWRSGSNMYHDILRPQLTTTMGYCMLIGSPPTKDAPTGSEWFRRLELSFKEEIKNGSKEYAVFHSTIYESEYITPEERDNLKRITDPATWATEYLGNYVDSIGQVYWEFDPLTRKNIIDPNESILARIRGLDFGIADNTACAWVNLLSNNRIYISDEYIANNMDVPTHARAIKSKSLLPVQWTVLDSACWARDASLTSVAKRFAAEGIGCTQGTKDLDGSVSDLKLMFANGSIIINPACTGLLQAIDSWQHGQHEPDILAAVRYGIDALIRSGKLMHPIRVDRPKTIQEHFKDMDEMDRRTKMLNAKFFSTDKRPTQSFKVINR